MSINWFAYKNLGLGKYVAYVIRNNETPAVYDNVSYSSMNSANDVMTFENLHGKYHVEPIIIRNYFEGGKEKKSKSEDF